ncbi:uncharacterized protein LOC113746901 isoform X2 [Larimichthys crocea]|uniref:uncharacterized protein LOC113746901 isoform X2 n=1 Tax=Larimichthys crocea TaxID=215358 RepID=UPI000F5DCCD3|nr:uncharacterized protein LOC113746901 isoform X2 [Larimichthys crocea]
MSSENNDRMDQEPPQVTAETLRPLVDLFLDQLMATQWGKDKAHSVDDKTKAALTDICVDIVNAMSKVIFEAFLQNRLAHTKTKTPPESPEMISEEEVQEYLGNSIDDAFVTVTGSPVPRESAKRLTDLVTKKITERINSQLTRTLQIMVKPVGSMLKSCKAKMSRVTVDAWSPDTAAESTSPAEREETPVFPIGPEDRCSVGSFIDTTTEAVKQILLEHVSDPEVQSNSDISEEERLQIINSINEDTDEAASEIAHYIWTNRKEFGLNNDGTPRPEAQSSRLNCWNVVANKIKSLFARKFAKEAIASFIVKLRTKLNCKEASLDVLIPAADKVVQDMIPENPDECTYKTMATCINNGQHEVHSQQLGHIIFENIQSDPGARKVNHVTIQNEVDKFMKMTCNWLNQQRQKLTKKNNSVDDSLRKIRGALELPELPEDIVTPVESAAPSSPAESGVSGDEDISTTPVTELRPPSITDEPIAIADEEDENLSPKFESATPRVTDEPALSDRSEPAEPAELIYVKIAAAVVHQCLKKAPFSVSYDEKKKIILTLKDMLCTGGVDFKSIQPAGHQVEKTARAVHKDLCAAMKSSKSMVALGLLSKDSLVYESVIETLKRQLEKPQKTGIKRLFTSLFNTVTKPFNGKKTVASPPSCSTLWFL